MGLNAQWTDKPPCPGCGLRLALHGFIDSLGRRWHIACVGDALKEGHMETPPEIEPHEPKYRPNAWQDYTPEELGEWVHLLLKRAGHRTPEDRDAIAKDIIDASNYLAMLGQHVNHVRRTLLGI